MNDINDSDDNEIIKILNKLPNLESIFNISMLIDVKRLIEYTKMMNGIKIKQYFQQNGIIDIGEKYSISISMALMYKNPKMQDFIYEILKKKNNNDPTMINKSKFIELINQVNTDVITGIQSGGFLIKKFLYEVGLVGLIITAIFYDYFIITNGAWGRMGSAINTIGYSILSIQEGCPPRPPSFSVNLISRFTDDPRGVELIATWINCVSSNPELLKENLKNIKINSNEYKKEINEVINEVFKPIPESSQNSFQESTELVLYEANSKEIVSNLKNQIIFGNGDENVGNSDENYDLVKIQQRLESIANLPLYDLEKIVYPSRVQPRYTNTPQTTISSIGEFFKDAFGAVGEILSYSSITTSLSFQNSVLWTIKENAKEALYKMQDLQTKTSRDIDKIVTDAIMIFSDIVSIPKIFSFLFLINNVAFLSIYYFFKKIRGVIDEDEPNLGIGNGEIPGIGNGEIPGIGNGGRRRRRKRNTIRKQKQRTRNYKNYKKIQKTRGKKSKRRKTCKK
jgi:hypothetical protein